MDDNFCKLVMDTLQELKKGQSAMNDKFDRGETVFRTLENALNDHATQSAERYKTLIQAFPADDVQGHRRYHEAQIEKIELRNRVVRECLVLCAKTGGVVGVGWLVHAIWVAAKYEITGGV